MSDLNFSIESIGSIGSASVDFSVDSVSSSEEEQITDEDEEVDVYQSIPVDLNSLIFADSWGGADTQVDTDGISEYSTEGNSPFHSPTHSGAGTSERIEDLIALAAGTRMSSASQKAAALRMRLQGHTMEAFIGAHSKCDSNLTRTATRLIEKGYSPLEVTAAIAASDEAAPIDLEMLHRAVSSDASTGAECLPSSSASPRQEQFKSHAMDAKYRLLPSGTFGRTALQTIGGMFHHLDRRKCGRWDGDDFGRFLQQVACGPSWSVMSCVTDDTSLSSCVTDYTSAAPMFLEAAVSLPLLAVHPSNFGHRLPTAGEGRVQHTVLTHTLYTVH
jgi:hypothetical protein